MITSDKRHHFNRMNSQSFQFGLGTELDRKVAAVRGRYDFSVQGGAVGSFNLLEDLDDTQSTITIPDNAIITFAMVDILTAMASAGGAGTIALSSEGAGDLLAAVDADTLSGLVAGIPVKSAATAIKMTADRTLAGAIAVEALTAGKFDLYVEFYLGN